MIHDYTRWKLLEDFGNGEETFTQDLDKYGDLRNLDFTNFPKAWGDLEDAVGKITFTAKLDVNDFGVEDIYFSIESINLEIESRVYKKPTLAVKYGISDKDDDGELITTEFSITRAMIKKDPKITVGTLPFYLSYLEIDFSVGAVDEDGKIDYSKVNLEAIIGQE